MLAFMIKAAVATLQSFPEFNASLDGDNLVLKQYYHIGFAADTPQGLVVPVIRDADRKGVIEIAKEMGELAKLARDGKLDPDQMQGGCFTISAWAASAASTSRRSSTRPRSRSWACAARSEAGLHRRQDFVVAVGAAAVAVLGSPRDRRRRRRRASTTISPRCSPTCGASSSEPTRCHGQHHRESRFPISATSRTCRSSKSS